MCVLSPALLLLYDVTNKASFDNIQVRAHLTSDPCSLICPFITLPILTPEQRESQQLDLGCIRHIELQDS